jgi:hypothetical protein
MQARRRLAHERLDASAQAGQNRRRERRIAGDPMAQDLQTDPSLTGGTASPPRAVLPEHDKPVHTRARRYACLAQGSARARYVTFLLTNGLRAHMPLAIPPADWVVFARGAALHTTSNAFVAGIVCRFLDRTEAIVKAWACRQGRSRKKVAFRQMNAGLDPATGEVAHVAHAILMKAAAFARRDVTPYFAGN